MRDTTLLILGAVLLAGGCAGDPMSGTGDRQRVSPEPARPAPARPAPVTDAPLPAFGDYVYVEELPEVIEKVAPEFPTDLKEGIEGVVIVQALVGTDGRVKDTRVVKSIPMLDDAVVAAVRQWVFKPAEAKGNPVAVWVAVPFRFPPR